MTFGVLQEASAREPGLHGVQTSSGIIGMTTNGVMYFLMPALFIVLSHSPTDWDWWIGNDAAHIISCTKITAKCLLEVSAPQDILRLLHRQCRSQRWIWDSADLSLLLYARCAPSIYTV